jgi:hypothetical protein
VLSPKVGQNDDIFVMSIGVFPYFILSTKGSPVTVVSFAGKQADVVSQALNQAAGFADEFGANRNLIALTINDAPAIGTVSVTYTDAANRSVTRNF